MLTIPLIFCIYRNNYGDYYFVTNFVNLWASAISRKASRRSRLVNIMLDFLFYSECLMFVYAVKNYFTLLTLLVLICGPELSNFHVVMFILDIELCLIYAHSNYLLKLTTTKRSDFYL